MSLSLSIFQKTCPGCASIVSIGAERCDCGHSFDAAANNQSPLELTLRDEELYEGYLTARAEQARQAARAAAEALAGNAANPGLVSASALAQEVAISIESDLAEQRAKIASIRSSLPEPSTLPALEPVAPILSVQPVTTKPSPVSAKATSAKSAPAAMLPPTPADPEKTHTVIAPVKPAPASLWQATSTRKAADVLAAIKHAKVREAIARAQQAKAAAAAQASIPVAANAHSAAAPPAFRKEQASKAETIMEAHRTVDGKECPNCTSSVPLNTTRCQCGFAFKDISTELPSLTLCTGDFTALRNSLNLNLRR